MLRTLTQAEGAFSLPASAMCKILPSFQNELEKLGQTCPLCDLLKRGSWFSWACSAHPFPACLEVRLHFLLFRMYQCVGEKLNTRHCIHSSKGNFLRKVSCSHCFSLFLFQCSIRDKVLILYFSITLHRFLLLPMFFPELEGIKWEYTIRF